MGFCGCGVRLFVVPRRVSGLGEWIQEIMPMHELLVILQRQGQVSVTVFVPILPAG